ncbi:MAG: UDP-N-acetylmuramoyl-L-alanine--D-glutamate ligase [Acidobacteriota bacterium]
MKRTEVAGKRILVVGLARSGVAAANLLLARGARVSITDLKPREQLAAEVRQLKGPVHFSLGGHRQEDFIGADLIVLSPGIPLDLEPLREAAARRVPIWGEVELAYRFLNGIIIGVTGSNGKTTTTALLGELFKRAGTPAVVAGNIGTPLVKFAEASEGHDRRSFIVELSSFQLESIDRFHCHIALVLNVTADHLDRYSSMREYAAAKERIFRNEEESDFAVLNREDPITLKMAARRRSTPLLFSSKRPLKEGVVVDKGRIWIHWRGRKRSLMRTRDIRLKGIHNLENVLAATAAGFLSGLDPEKMAEAIRTFAGVEHRLEWVREVDGVVFYNDSKATNVDSARKAIESFRRPLILIMGGLDKGADFRALGPLVKSRVRLLLLLGQAGPKIADALGHFVSTVQVKDLEEALSRAVGKAQRGDVVLLAPACASFDMFNDFEHRGDVFKQIVHRIKAKTEVVGEPS